MAVCRDLLATPDIPLPILRGVIEAPTFNSDGSIHIRSGYDPIGQTYYSPAASFKVPEVPERPQARHIELAKRLILTELLGDHRLRGQVQVCWLML